MRGAAASLATCVVLASTCALPAGAQPTDPATIVLRGARLIDGTGSPPIDDAVIVVRDGRIVAAGESGSTAVPSGAQVFDYRGKTIIPGLISTHVHVGITDGLRVGAENYSWPNILRQLRQYERYGVTTVVALGLNGPALRELRSELHAGQVAGADLFGADRGIGAPRGAPPAAMLPVGADQLYRPATAAEARAAVREMAARETDLVKLWVDDFGGTLPVTMTRDIYEAAIDEAHGHGLRVAVHVHDLEDARAVVAAGADIVAHGVRDAPVDEAFVALMKARGTWYLPTLALDEATFTYAQPPQWTRGRFFEAGLDPALREQLADEAWQQKIRSAPASAAARAALGMNQRNLKRLYDAGVKIGFGTDSGATPLRIAGIAEHRELALAVEAGLTPLQAITLATANGAALLELTDRGAIAPGRWADLLVLDADPSIDIAATTRIAAVWHRGRLTREPLPR